MNEPPISSSTNRTSEILRVLTLVRPFLYCYLYVDCYYDILNYMINFCVTQLLKQFIREKMQKIRTDAYADIYYYSRPCKLKAFRATYIRGYEDYSI